MLWFIDLLQERYRENISQIYELLQQGKRLFYIK